jgi:hypothetical protein
MIVHSIDVFYCGGDTPTFDHKTEPNGWGTKPDVRFNIDGITMWFDKPEMLKELAAEALVAFAELTAISESASSPETVPSS